MYSVAGRVPLAAKVGPGCGGTEGGNGSKTRMGESREKRRNGSGQSRIRAGVEESSRTHGGHAVRARQVRKRAAKERHDEHMGGVQGRRPRGS